MTDETTPDWRMNLAVVCVALGLVFAGVALFEAAIKIHLVAHPWGPAVGLWAMGLGLYLASKRARRSAAEAEAADGAPAPEAPQP